jgi:hypothetical protein
MLISMVEEILKKIPEELEQLTIIDLSSCNLNKLDDAKFYSLCNAIMFCSNLEVFIVCNTGITQLDQHKLNSFFYAIGTLKNLNQLNLSHSELNHISENGMHLLCNAISNIRTGRSPQEELSLNISNNNLTKEQLLKLKAVANIPESITTTTKNSRLNLSF